MLEVAERLEFWLSQAPDGPISLESGAAKGAVKALVDGWGSRMMRALAARPLSLTELDSAIADLSYPALERRLSGMRLAGLVEAQPSKAAGTPYAVTEWAPRGVLPIAAASFEGGKVVSCVSRLEPDPPAYAVGSAVKWFDAVRGGKVGELRFGGSRQIAEDVVAGLHASFA